MGEGRGPLRCLFSPSLAGIAGPFRFPRAAVSFSWAGRRSMLERVCDRLLDLMIDADEFVLLIPTEGSG